MYCTMHMHSRRPTGGHREKNRKKITITDAAKQQTQRDQGHPLCNGFLSLLVLQYLTRTVDKRIREWKKVLVFFLSPLRITEEEEEEEQQQQREKGWLNFREAKLIFSFFFLHDVAICIASHRSFILFSCTISVGGGMGNGLSLGNGLPRIWFFFFLLAHRTVRKWRKTTHTHITVELDASLDGITAREKKVVL